MRFDYLLIATLTLACSKQAGPTANADGPASADVAAQAPAAGPKAADKAAIGQPAPDFELTSLDGKRVKLSEHRGKIVVLEWFNPDCPYVREAHGGGSLKGMAAKQPDDVVWLAVNSGAPGKQGHSEEANRAGKERFNIAYPILMDADGRVGRMYAAERTPHMYVIDPQGTLVYAGALDNTGSGDPEDAEPQLINYVADALSSVRDSKPVATSSSKAWGCSVKYAN